MEQNVLKLLTEASIVVKRDFDFDTTSNCLFVSFAITSNQIIAIDFWCFIVYSVSVIPSTDMFEFINKDLQY